VDVVGADGEPRSLIERSWKRSSACGLVPERADLELPYDTDFDGDCRLARAAQPVVERLVTAMADTSHSLLLADPGARIIQRWLGSQSLSSRLDRSSIAPGFGFTEEFAGTNGVGTALEEGKTVAVLGGEHFAESLRPFSCVGVPIRNPLGGSIEGVLDFTCFSSDFNPLMPPLLVEAVKHIETRLAQLSSTAESALLECYLNACRKYRGPVVALRSNMFLTNPAAAEQINNSDHTVIWDAATTSVKMHQEDSGVVDLQSGPFRMLVTVVDDSGPGEPGIVAQLVPEITEWTAACGPRPVRRGPDRATALPGRSPQWRHVRDRLAELAEIDEPIAITGAEGIGKMSVARQLHAQAHAVAGLHIFDSHGESSHTKTRLVDRCRDALAAGDTVIVRRIDQLPAASRTELERLARNAVGPFRLIVTCSDDPSDAALRGLAAFPHQLWLPPLAQRVGDVADLIPSLLAELSPDRVITCALPAQQALLRYSWPGNIAQLRDVLAAALQRAVQGQIEVSSLPPWLLKQAHRRQLSPIEQSERDIIIDTLASVGNNRSEVARILGIGRATLYRKMRNLGIANGHELT
jgi:transcriptional regulator of acetoin/glycerol metabolism